MLFVFLFIQPAKLINLAEYSVSKLSKKHIQCFLSAQLGGCLKKLIIFVG